MLSGGWRCEFGFHRGRAAKVFALLPSIERNANPVPARLRAFMHVGARFRTSAQRSLNQFEFSIKFDKPNQMHVGARSSLEKCQFVSDQERLSAFDVLLTATICEAKSIKSPQDNVNVHRAAAKDIVFKSRAARGSVCIVLLSRRFAAASSVISGTPLGQIVLFH